MDRISIADLSSDSRWPRWAWRAHNELGFGSILSLPLLTPNRTLGALSLYSSRPDAFTRAGNLSADALASHVAAAMTSDILIHSLQNALTSRSVTGQATGILMQRYGVASDRAFDILVRASQTSNQKLVALARHVVEAGPESIDFKPR